MSVSWKVFCFRGHSKAGGTGGWPAFAAESVFFIFPAAGFSNREEGTMESVVGIVN